MPKELRNLFCSEFSFFVSFDFFTSVKRTILVQDQVDIEQAYIFEAFIIKFLFILRIGSTDSVATSNIKMTSDSISLEQSEVEGSCTLSETKATESQQSTIAKSHLPGAENDSKKRGNSPLSETRLAKRQKNSGIKKYASIEGNNPPSVAPDDLEFEIEKTRFEVLNHFINMKTKMDRDDKVIAKEIEILSRKNLDNINGGKSLQNEFFIKSLADNFEEIIRKIGNESKREVNYNMDDIQKVLIKLFYKIERSCIQIPRIEAVKVPRRDAENFLRFGFWSLVAVFIVVFPDYLLTCFESSEAFYESTILPFLYDVFF